MKPKNVLRPLHVTRSPVKPKAVLLPSEAEVQAQIVQGLRWLGYTVLQTSRRRVCGPDGADRGVPDLLVTRKEWAKGLACLLEVKGPKTRLSPEQAALEILGRIVVVRSFEEARRAVEAFERSLEANHAGGVTHPRA